MFITFEGPDGCGKTTQVKLVYDMLLESYGQIKNGCNIVKTREPGGTPGAEAIRNIILDPSIKLLPETVLKLFFASRYEHVETLIKPSLARGDIVMCDRFCDSTLVYQHYGVGLSKKLIMDEIEKISLEPDLTIVLSAPWEVCLDRRNQRNAGAKSDRYESLDDSFSKRVYDGYLELASANQHRCIIVDANRTPSVVAEDIFSIVSLVMINKGKLNAAPDFAARMRF